MQDQIKRVNKEFFIWVFISPVIVPVVIALFRYLGSITRMPGGGGMGFYMILGAVYVIFIVVCIIVFHYIMWDAIYHERVRTSPGIAVLLLFVPIYNLIWIFMFYFGFVKYYNELVEYYHVHIKRDDRETDVQPIEGYAFFAMPVLAVLGVIMKFVEAGTMATIVYILAYVVFLVVVWQTCDAVNTLVDAVKREM